MHHHSGAFVGIDTSKLRNAVAVAEEGRDGEVRYFGEIDTTEAANGFANRFMRACVRRSKFLPDGVSLRDARSERFRIDRLGDARHNLIGHGRSWDSLLWHEDLQTS